MCSWSRPVIGATWFEASVFVLLALEILGCSLGVLSLRGRTRKHSTPEFNSNLPKQGHYQFAPQPIQRAHAGEILSVEGMEADIRSARCRSRHGCAELFQCHTQFAPGK